MITALWLKISSEDDCEDGIFLVTFIYVYKEGIYLTTSEGDVDLCEQVRVPPQYLKEWKLDLSYS